MRIDAVSAPDCLLLSRRERDKCQVAKRRSHRKYSTGTESAEN